MKNKFLTRQSILRAIRAACMALFFATAAAVHAQTATRDGKGNVTIAGSGTDFMYSGTSPILAPGRTLTVAPGSTITNTNSNYVIDLSEAATITNNGILSVRGAAGNANFVAAIASIGGAQPTTIHNLGTASGIAVGNGATAAGISYDNLQGATGLITNSGSIYGSGATAFGIEVSSTAGGDLSVENYGTGLISTVGKSDSGTAAGIHAESATGTIVISNRGMIDSHAVTDAYGIEGTSSSGGKITIANAGSISASNSGAYVIATGIGATTAGAIDISSMGKGGITADGARNIAYGINANSSGGNVEISNAGTAISASGYYTAIGINATAAGSITIDNGGAISGISTGHGGQGGVASAGIGIYTATTGGGGNVNVKNTGDVTAFGTYYDEARPYSTSAAALYGSTEYGTGNVSIANSGAINAGDIASGYITNVSGIEAISTDGVATITNSGSRAITVSGHGFATGIVSSSEYGSTFVTNTSSGLISVTGSASSYSEVAGIESSSGYDHQDVASIMNSGPVSVSGRNASALYGFSVACVNIVNQGALFATSFDSGIGINAFCQQTGTVSILNEGEITLGGSGRNIGIFCNATQASVSVTNSGSISVPNGTGIGVYSFDSPSLTIANTGPITAGECIFDEGQTAIVTNSGHLTSSGYASIGFAIGTFSDCTLTNTSSGTISATSTGDSVGIQSIAFRGSSTVINGAAITSTSKSGYAYGLQSASIYGSGAVYVISVENRGALSSTGSSAYCIASTSEDGGDTLGTFSVQNTGILASTSTGRAGSAFGIHVSDESQTLVTNIGAIHATASSEYSQVADIAVNGSSVMLTNSGSLTGIGGLGYATAIEAASGGATSVTNQGALLAVGSSGASGLFSYGLDDTVVSTASITSLSSAGSTLGIMAESNGGSLGVTNSGTITCIGNSASGIYAEGGSNIEGPARSNVSLNNTGAITVIASQENAYGIEAFSTGDITVTNNADVMATSRGTQSTASGIYISFGLGTNSVTNSGYAGGFAPKGYGYGIEADAPQTTMLNNTGTAKGTTVGIYSEYPGIVDDSGVASGGTYSIEVPTGSTVNLNDYGAVHGLIKGGLDDTSTSELNFNLKVRGNLAAAEASLNAAIAKYDAALAGAPQGPDSDVDSEVVRINGVKYKWEDFAGITDDLVQGQAYGNRPGYHGLGSTIDNFNADSARGASILGALDGLPDSAGALAQLSPQSLQVLRHIAFDNADFTSANVDNHLANLRDGLTGFDTSGFTINAPGADPTLTQMRSRLLAWQPAPFDHGLLSDSSAPWLGGVDMKGATAMVNTQPVDRWSAFISGSVILANLDNSPANAGDSSYTTGSVLGRRLPSGGPSDRWRAFQLCPHQRRPCRRRRQGHG